MKNLLTFLLAVILAGCLNETHDVQKLEPGTPPSLGEPLQSEDETYRLHDQSYFTFGTTGATLKSQLLKEAYEICNSIGKKMLLLNYSSSDPIFLDRVATADVYFKCVEKNH